MSTAFGQTYSIGAVGTGWRKLDILERIIDQDPRATPFFEMTGMTDARATKHEWQVRGVPARAENTNVEGFSFQGQEVDIPDRVSNTTQILDTPVEITRTSQKEMHYGVADIWQDQIDHFTYVHRADTEWALLRETEVTGATGTAREMDGLLSSITTNATAFAAGGGVSLTESIFITGIKIAWDNNDMPMLDAMCNSSIKRGIDQFASVGAVRNMEVRTRDIVHTVTKYFSSFGEVDIHLSRDLLDRVGVSANCELVYFDRRQMKKAYLDRTHLQPVAKTKDADTLVILSELTLEYGNEKSAVKFTDLNVSL